MTDACEGLVEDLREWFALPSVYLLIEGRLRCQAARGYFQVVDGFTPGIGVIGEVVTTGVPVVLRDVRQHPQFIAAIPGLTAEACAPVWLGGAVVGAVNVESASELPGDVGLVLAAAAAALAARIDAAGGLPEAALSQRLARIAVGLSVLTQTADIEAGVAAGAVNISGMNSAALCRRDQQGRWRMAHARGPLTAALVSWTEPMYCLLASWVRAGTSSHFRGDPADALPSGYEFLARAGVRAVMVQALVTAGEVTGLLITAHTEPVAHDPVVGAAMELLAAQAAACLGMAGAMEELGRRALEDSLTGLGNAAAFTEDLGRAAHAGVGTPGHGCLLIDIDRFKDVNDTYGHLAGDRLLRALADELSSVVRSGDSVYRIGGDEFAALLYATTAQDMGDIAVRLVQAARRVRTTISLGAALSRSGGTAEQLRIRADRALYKAKTAGRDQAVTAD